MIAALITARGGSKGLPGKNILPLHGVPLIGWSIEAALQCPEVGCCYVSSDDDEILSVSSELGASVIKRPIELATDLSSSEDVIAHFIKVIHAEGVYPDQVVLLQPTSPLRGALHVSGAVSIFDEENADCVISVFEPKHSPLKAYKLDKCGRLEGLYGPGAPYQPRQELPKAFQPNGAIYLFDVAAFVAERGIPKKNVYPYFMRECDSVDIDDQQDFNLAESLLRKKNDT